MKSLSHEASPFRTADYFKITVLGFALAALANSMHAIILPLRVEALVGPSHKSTYLGLLTFTGLIIAMLVQPVIGAVSDHTGSCWGRRRPYILAGIIAAIVLLTGIGFFDSYIAIFLIWCLIQAAINTAQGPYQAFIPDLIPEDKRGLASGVKNLLEIAGGVVLLRLIGNFMGKYSAVAGGSQLWLSLGVLGAVLLAALLITVITIREKPVRASVPGQWKQAVLSSFRFNIKAKKGFVLFLISRLLFIMALTTLQTFALYYFQDVVGIANPAEITADLITAVGIAMLVIVYPAGRYSDRIGRQPLLIASGFLAAIGIAIIFFFHVYTLILVAGVLIGLAAGSFLSTNWALAIDLVPAEEAGLYLGLTNLASAGGGAMARLIGPGIDFFNGYGSGLGYSFMLGACFLYFIVGAILVWRIKPIKPRSD